MGHGDRNLACAAALVDALDVNDIETVRAVLRADLVRLRDWLAGGQAGAFWGEYAMDGALNRVGAGAVIWAQVDLRHFVTDPAEQWGTLRRLVGNGLLSAVPGVTVQDEVL